MAVEGFDARQDLAIVSARDEDLCARADGGLEDGEGAGGELVLFDLGNLIFSQFRPGLRHELLDLCVNHVCDYVEFGVVIEAVEMGGLSGCLFVYSSKRGRIPGQRAL